MIWIWTGFWSACCLAAVLTGFIFHKKNQSRKARLKEELAALFCGDMFTESQNDTNSAV